MMNQCNRRTPAVFAVLSALLFLLFFLNLLTGSVSVSLMDIFSVLRDTGEPSKELIIIRELRLPRALSAIMLGGALSVSGFLLQTFFRNPIAGPYIMGVSSGAKLFVACFMLLVLRSGTAPGSLSLVAAAFLGSLATLAIVMFVSYYASGMAELVVCGVMIGYVCSAFTEFVLAFAPDSHTSGLHNWSMGSFSGISGHDVAAIAMVVIPSFFAALGLAKPMQAFLSGETFATSVGVDVKRLRGALILLSGLLSAAVTAFAGPISFVGIAVPHLMRAAFDTQKPLVLLPGSFLGGAVFCLFCDLIARNLFAPMEMSISQVTAVFGAPVVVWVLLDRK